MCRLPPGPGNFSGICHRVATEHCTKENYQSYNYYRVCQLPGIVFIIILLTSARILVNLAYDLRPDPFPKLLNVCSTHPAHCGGMLLKGEEKSFLPSYADILRFYN